MSAAIARESERQRMLNKISDSDVRAYIEASAGGDPNARERIELYLRQRRDQLIGESLFPTAKRPLREIEVYTKWDALANDICIAAERLWRDSFLEDKTNAAARQRLRPGRSSKQRDEAIAQLGHLQLLCQQSHQLMLLWLETALYHIRAMINVRAGGAAQEARGREDSVAGQISARVKAYVRTLREWRRELRREVGVSLFLTFYEDAQRLKTLNKTFSKADAAELGWITRTADAHTELRYQFFNMRLRERRQDGRWVSALIYLARKGTTGYGMKPWRFVGTALGTIIVFAALFFLNDFFNPGLGSPEHFCAESNIGGQSLPGLVLRYLYLAVTNLTSLGSDETLAKYCGGGFTEVLLIAGSITGYFLLALLASLLYQQMTEADV